MIEEIIAIAEEKISSNYKMWDYIEDPVSLSQP